MEGRYVYLNNNSIVDTVYMNTTNGRKERRREGKKEGRKEGRKIEGR